MDSCDTLEERMEEGSSKREKNPLYKNEGQEPIHQKYRPKRAQEDTTQRKNKSKQSTKIK